MKQGLRYILRQNDFLSAYDRSSALEGYWKNNRTYILESYLLAINKAVGFGLSSPKPEGGRIYYNKIYSAPLAIYFKPFDVWFVSDYRAKKLLKNNKQKCVACESYRLDFLIRANSKIKELEIANTLILSDGKTTSG